MYSNSSSFLGGANSGRPGPSAYGQSPFSNIQPVQQQSNGFALQPTGLAGSQIQPQYTGFPGQGLGPQQPQFTTYPQQNQQSFQNPSPQHNSAPLLQQQQQQQQPGQASQNQIPPQRTGQTSAQVAQSFQPTPSIPTTTSKPLTTGTKIPKIRLSFLTAQDQAKFEQLFKSAVGNGQALDGDKVRDLLIRSKLPGSDLMHIWVLSDTTKSGQLLFPEFALAMYLCNLKLVGKDLPQALPERIANEVSSMVDIISFGVPDDRPQALPRSNAPNFDSPSRSTSSPNIQQPQPQASNSQLLTQLTSQPTGFASQYIPPQLTGLPQQPTGLTSQQSAFRPQATGFQQVPQAPSYSGLQPPQPPMPPIPTGFNSNLPQSQTNTHPPPLNAQPTGAPGQWGFVNSPASGLPNIDALHQRMMPQPGREGGFTTAGLSGSATVPWAVTKDEKKIYDHLFTAWDGFNKGFIGGDVAIEVMEQSGLEKSDLEKIWTLSDPGNRGRLDKDEFAVAMHLIYRKLNGYPVPNRLPPELVPPSTRNFADSIGTVKSLLSQDAEIRKNTGAFLQPQKTGVSYLKNHSFRNESNGVSQGRKDATVFRNNDDAIGYKSSARRRLGGGGRTPSPVQPASPASEGSSEEYSVEQLRKKIREKQILLDAIDFQEENNADEDDILDRKDRRDAEDLYHRIRRCQEEIDRHPNSTLRLVDSKAERRVLKRQLQSLTDKLPELASHVRKTEQSIADAKLELFRLKDAIEHPNTASAVIGTGPGGAVTEADRLKARAKAMMQQRSAALTGRKSSSGVDEASMTPRRLEAEQSRIRTEKENNERMIKDVEESVRDFSRGLEDSLTEDTANSSSEHERRRWEDGLGVEDDVKEFIFDLQRSSRSTRIRQEDVGRTRPDSKGRLVSQPQESGRDTLAKELDNPVSSNAVISQPSSTFSSPKASYSSYKTAEERAAFIKQQAEQRMAERLAALGLKPPTTSGESTKQRQDREAKEREERVRQAEAEDAKRDQERQRRLADEDSSTINAPKSSNKKPPPPPSRKSRAEGVGQAVEARRQEDVKDTRFTTDQEGKEQVIKEQQKAQRLETESIENEAQRQEEELAMEREAAQARLKSLEDQVKAGKIRKQEEKRRKQAAEKEAREKEVKLAAQRAELEAAKERERQLQLQLESLEDEESSDEDGPQEITPQETTPTNSFILPKERALSPEEPAATSQRPLATDPKLAFDKTNPLPAQNLPAVSSYNSDTKNPFFKKLSQSNESGVMGAGQSLPSVSSPAPNEVSTNPFHRLTQQENIKKSAPPLSSTPTGSRPSRIRPEEDEWSVVDSAEDSSEDDGNERPTGGSAKQLASMLFGTMAPPRPLSAMDNKKSPTTPSVDLPMTPTMSPPPMASIGSTDVLSAPAPPPPPMPASGASPGGPPPPPPMPASFVGSPPAPPLPGPYQQPVSGVAVAGPPAVGALLGDIVKGKGLKKVETRDRSQASVAGRVLG